MSQLILQSSFRYIPKLDIFSLNSAAEFMVSEYLWSVFPEGFAEQALVGVSFLCLWHRRGKPGGGKYLTFRKSALMSFCPVSNHVSVATLSSQMNMSSLDVSWNEASQV